MEIKETLRFLIFFLVIVLTVASTKRRRFEQSKGINGLDTIILRGRHNNSVEVYLYGGQVMSWKNKIGEELLVVSSKAIFNPPTPMRGGIHLCFPQYSNLGPLPAHGFARNRLWKVETNAPPLPSNFISSSFVDLILKSTEEDLKIWPHNFEYRLRVALGHKGDLTVTSRVKNTNTDGKSFTFTFAYHPYFAVSDISNIQVKGLENVAYLDQQKNRTRFPGESNPITFKSQFDRLYQRTPANIKIIDFKKKKTTIVHKEGLPDVVVWNPWEKKVSDLGVEDYRRFVAVEPAATEKPVELKPGQEWKGTLQAFVVPFKLLH